MNILIWEYKNFGIEDIKDALTAMGHSYKCITSELIRDRVNSDFDQLFENTYESEHFDCVFTFNYCPIISTNCNRTNTPYIAWIYDSPLVTLYSYTIINPCNYIFMFDRALYNELKTGGINTIYYCPLAVHTQRLDAMLHTAGQPSVEQPFTEQPFAKQPSAPVRERFRSQISFVGSMYNEKHNLFERLKDISPYTKGYLDAIMEAQLQVYGDYFIEKLLTSSILEEMQRCAPVHPNKDGIETASYLYAYYFIARKLAEKERHQILDRLSRQFKVNLYTPAPTPELPRVHNMGPVDYYNHMPYIFHYSDINLNISLRSIRSGIPLRCMDVMGAGGFLMSNYQADFYDYFIPGEDLVLYESQDDLASKCNYYLSHDNERKQIAINGYHKIKESHTYEVRLSEIFNIVFP